MRGICYTKMGQLDTAISELEQALKLDPQIKNGWFYFSAALFQAGKHEEAIKGIRSISIG